MFPVTVALYILLSEEMLNEFVREQRGSTYLAPFISAVKCWQGLVLWLWWGENYSFLYQIVSPVVKQCDRKSVELWCLSSVLCPSTFSSRSSSRAHLRGTVRSLWMTHPRENELYGAGSLANKHFTTCRVCSSTCWLTAWTHRPQTQSDKPALQGRRCEISFFFFAHVNDVSSKHTTARRCLRLEGFFF